MEFSMHVGVRGKYSDEVFKLLKVHPAGHVFPNNFKTQIKKGIICKENQTARSMITWKYNFLV